MYLQIRPTGGTKVHFQFCEAPYTFYSSGDVAIPLEAMTKLTKVLESYRGGRSFRPDSHQRYAFLQEREDVFYLGDMPVLSKTTLLAQAHAPYPPYNRPDLPSIANHVQTCVALYDAPKERRVEGEAGHHAEPMSLGDTIRHAAMQEDPDNVDDDDFVDVDDDDNND